MWIHKPSMRNGKSLCRKRRGSQTAGESSNVVVHDMPVACISVLLHAINSLRFALIKGQSDLRRKNGLLSCMLCWRRRVCLGLSLVSILCNSSQSMGSMASTLKLAPDRA